MRLKLADLQQYISFYIPQKFNIFTYISQRKFFSIFCEKKEFTTTKNVSTDILFI